VAKAAALDLATQQTQAKVSLVEVETASKATTELLKTTAARQVINSGQASDTLIAPLLTTTTSSERTKSGTVSSTRTRVARASDRNSEHVFVEPSVGHRPNQIAKSKQPAIEHAPQLTRDQLIQNQHEQEQLEMNNLRAEYQNSRSDSMINKVVTALAQAGVDNPFCLIVRTSQGEWQNRRSPPPLYAHHAQSYSYKIYVDSMYSWLKRAFKAQSNQERLVEINRVFQ